MIEDFAHRLMLSQIRDGERIELIADEKERDATAERLGLDRIERLEAHVTLKCDGSTIRATGRIVAALDQSCVITGEPVAAMIDEPFDILFMPEPAIDSREEEIELAEQDCDVVFHDGQTIDLGAAVADTLALSLDPYPRSAGAEAVLREAGVISESEAGPFAALAKLKKGRD